MCLCMCVHVCASMCLCIPQQRKVCGQCGREHSLNAKFLLFSYSFSSLEIRWSLVIALDNRLSHRSCSHF